MTEACKAGAPGVVEYVVMKKGDTPPGGMFVVEVRVDDPEAGAVREGVQGGHVHVVHRGTMCVSLRWGCPWHGRLCVQDAVCVWCPAGVGPKVYVMTKTKRGVKAGRRCTGSGGTSRRAMAEQSDETCVRRASWAWAFPRVVSTTDEWVRCVEAVVREGCVCGELWREQESVWFREGRVVGG